MNTTRLICRVVRAILIVALLWSGFGLVGLAVGHIVTRSAESLAMPLLSYRFLPQLKVRARLASWDVFKKMFGHSGFTLLWSVAALVRDRASFVVIGVLLSAGAAGAYQIPVMLMQALDATTQALAAVTKPAASALVAEGRMSAVESLVMRGGRYVFAILIPTVVFVAFHADVLVPFWVGDQYPDAAALVVFLVLAQLPLTGQAVTTFVMIGMDRHRTLAVATLLSALLGVACMVGLVGWTELKLWGIAYGASFSMLLMGVLVLPVLICRALNVRWTRYVAHVFAVPAAATLPFAGVMLLIRWLMPGNTVWMVLVSGLVALPVLILCEGAFILTGDERRRVHQKVRRTLDRRAENDTQTIA